MPDKREVICGMMGHMHWKPVLPATGLEGLQVNGNWIRQEDILICEERQGSASIVFGQEDWANYELSVQVKAVTGGNVQVLFRLNPDGNYMMDMLFGWQAVAVSKNDRRPGGRGFHKISVVNFALEHGREYDVQIAVRDVSITTYIDGQLVNQVTDYDFPQGRAGLSVWQGKNEFRSPKIRLL